MSAWQITGSSLKVHNGRGAETLGELARIYPNVRPDDEPARGGRFTRTQREARISGFATLPRNTMTPGIVPILSLVASQEAQ